MMAHVISPRGLETWGKPPVHVNAPMDLFSHNHVDSPANKEPRKNSSQSDDGSKQNCRNSVYYEQKNNVQRGADKGHVFCLLGRTNLSVMLAMPGPCGTARAV